jgi:UDP:flavonoid glycosyltransferase YjiC (YdhE family)
MRILFTTVPQHGHFFPMVPLAHAMRARGHDVLVATPASLADAVTGAGLPVATTAPPLSFADIMTVDRHGRPVPQARNAEERSAAGGRAWGRLASRTVARTKHLVERWRPDIVVAEPSEYAGPVVAARNGIPWVEHGWGITAMPETRPYTAEEMAEILTGMELAGLPEPTLKLTVCPPSLADGQPTEAGRFQQMRYIPYNGQGVLPDWVLEERRMPRIFLTFGSLIPQYIFRDFVAVLGELASTLPRLGVEIVVGVDDAFARRLDALPAGVVAVGWQPLNMVLPGCDLVVHHGGPGSMLTALASGVPQLALPLSGDQFVNAFSLTRVGAGRMLSPDANKPDAVLAECRTLLDDTRYRDAAQMLAAEIAAMPSPADVVELLEKHVAG